MPTVSRKISPKLESDVPGLADELRPVLNRLARHLRRQAVSAGSSSLDVFILGMVKNQPGIGVSQLADMEDTTRPSMSAHVKRLRNAGWIAIDDSHSSDMRRSSLVLTEAGHEALAHVRQRSNDWLAKRLSSLTEKERAALKAALPAMTKLLSGSARK